MATTKPASGAHGPSSEKLRLIRIFNSPKHDIWTSIKFIYENETPGLVDFVVHRLFSFPEEEVEFYIPQLCNLMIHRPNLQSLEEFILIRCSLSIHFAIKVYLYLHANSNEFTHLKLNRAMRLLNATETVAINGESSSISYSSPFVYFPKDIGKTNTHFSITSQRMRNHLESSEPSSNYGLQGMSSIISEEANPPKALLHHQSPRDPSEMKSRRMTVNLGSISSPDYLAEGQSSRSTGRFARESRQAIDLESSSNFKTMTSQSSHSRSPPSSSPSPLATSGRGAPGTPSRDSLIPRPEKPTTMSQQTQPDSTSQSFYFYHSKGARSEYFTRVDSFLNSLTRVSEILRAVPVDQRNEALVKELEKLNNELPDALYVPLGTGSDRHHAVLRIPAQEAFTLRSKERVPFMLYYEVLEFQKKCSNPELSLGEIKKHPPTSLDETKVIDGAFGELMKNKETRLKKSSIYGYLPKWKLCSCIVKSGDDLRQDQLAIQLIEQFQKVFKEANLPLYLYSYRVLVTSSSSGFIEVVPNATSLDTLKRKTPEFTTLANYFTKTYTGSGPLTIEKARANFIESMAAYSLVCYFLQIKDRHNGNILITDEGHIVHIDFGFLLSNSPGSINFESAPFKLTQELADVMGGYRSIDFERFRSLFVAGFMEARKHTDKFLFLVDMARSLSQLPCFKLGKAAVDNMAARFCPAMDEAEAEKHARSLVDSSYNAWSTRQYDNFQYLTNGIL
eukprot:TRINITY_DN2535_c0_g3_i6.p1 TRINITY_DN2535_c0_g3~~TRINITY_DN2535_c0_g3_i6.p1  ORF type:complete len:733 (-),score=151.53 TRINITY_DN2535_c0_g3_i6:221-2419(-)